MKYTVELNSLGEIRMGVEAFGLQVTTMYGEFTSLWHEPILVNTLDYSEAIEKAKDGNMLCVRGLFATYILKLRENTISVYRVTIRGENGEWSEETPIYGSETTHINGFSSHYYIQFPFVPDSKLQHYISRYSDLRRAQIEQARSAL